MPYTYCRCGHHWSLHKDVGAGLGRCDVDGCACSQIREPIRPHDFDGNST